jgi:hypothetical protein
MIRAFSSVVERLPYKQDAVSSTLTTPIFLNPDLVKLSLPIAGLD